jgi:hypothetical protein
MSESVDGVGANAKELGEASTIEQARHCCALCPSYAAFDLVGDGSGDLGGEGFKRSGGAGKPSSAAASVTRRRE